MSRRRPGRPRLGEIDVPIRQLLVEATIRAVAIKGPMSVTAREVCHEANVMFASVNYNFGNWNGLLAAAASRVYTDLSSEVWGAVASAPREPEERLRAFVLAHVDWARRMPGWGALINYPLSSPEVTRIRLEKFADVTVTLFRENMARLAQLVDDVRQGRVTDVTDEAIPDLSSRRDLMLRAMSFAFSHMGASVWVSRGDMALRQVGTENAGGFDISQDDMIDFHIKAMIQAIRNEP